MAKVGRPTKFTPELVKKLLDSIRLGVAYKHACAYAGVTYETFNEWRKENAEFSSAVQEAEGAAVVANFAKIQKASGEGAWQASAWILERRYPEIYGRFMRAELTGAGGGPIQTQAQVVEIPAPIADVAQWAASAKAKGDDDQ